MTGFGADTVLIPALVAAIITLGIEYVAKPRLEVRKDRILEAARNERELQAALSRMHVLTVMVSDISLLEVGRQAYVREVNRLQTAADDVLDLAMVVGAQHRSPDVASVVGMTTSYAKGFAANVGEGTEELNELRLARLKDLSTVVGLLLAYFKASRWQPVVRSRALRALQEEAGRFSKIHYVLLPDETTRGPNDPAP